MMLNDMTLRTISLQRISELSRGEDGAVESPCSVMSSVVTMATVELHKLSFGYKAGVAVLNNLTVSFNPAFVALVGRSGSGKTTLINLLLGLYRPWQGEVLLQGRPVCTYEAKAFRDLIGVALQEPYLWDDTLENNIRFSKPAVQDSEIISAARVAGVAEFVG